MPAKALVSAKAETGDHHLIHSMNPQRPMPLSILKKSSVEPGTGWFITEEAAYACEPGRRDWLKEYSRLLYYSPRNKHGTL